MPAGRRAGRSNRRRTGAAPVAGSTAAASETTFAGSGSAAPTRMRAAAPGLTFGTSANCTAAATSSRRGSRTRRIGSDEPGSTRSPGLWERFATRPSNVARTTARPSSVDEAVRLAFASLSAASASASSRSASSRSLRAPTPRSNRSFARACALRAFWSRAFARSISARLEAVSAASDGISNLTSRSPLRTTSPSALGISTMRADAGAVTTKSAPGAGSTKPDTCAALRSVPVAAASTVTGTTAAVCDFFGAAAAAGRQGRKSDGDEDETAGGGRH